MLVRVCDNCEGKLEGAYLEDICLIVRRDKAKVCEIAGRDFCSYQCLRDYVQAKLEPQDRLCFS